MSSQNLHGCTSVCLLCIQAKQNDKLIIIWLPSCRNQNRSRRDSSASSSTVTSTHRDSGSERRSRRSKPTTTTTTTTTTTAANNNASLSSGIGQHSIDRSYDGELDESTLSNARFQGARPKDVRPKQQKSAVKGEKNQEKRADESLRSQSTRSGRSQSNSSLQDDETLEDLSDGGGWCFDSLILYLEDDGFRPWPNLPTDPRLSTLYTNMHKIIIVTPSKLFKIQEQNTRILANFFRWHYIWVLYMLKNDKGLNQIKGTTESIY